MRIGLEVVLGSSTLSVAEQLYTEPMLREAFAALGIPDLASHDDEVVKGAGHKRKSALIDMVARRPLEQFVVTGNNPAP